MNINEQSTHTCRVCGAKQTVGLWSVGGFDWEKCCSCRSLQTTRVCTASELAQYYASDYYEGYKGRQDQGAYINYIGQRAFIQSNLQKRVDWALRCMDIADGADWLDVGCAAGFLLDVVRGYGYAPWGIDYSDYGPHFARTSLAISGARQATIEALPADFPRCFDVITAIDVVEHVTHPQDMLVRCTNYLKPGGYLVCETFDPTSLLARVAGPHWHAIDPPNHFAILSLAGIDMILRQQGLKLVRTIRLPRWLSIPAIATKFGPAGRYVSGKLHESRLAAIGIPILLNDVVLWVYRKDNQNGV